MKSIHLSNLVVVKRNIFRKETGMFPYAWAGDKGIVIEIFATNQSPKEKKLSAKVAMNDGTIKTFRLTSIRRSDHG